jgi:hypothetical protein
MRGAATAALIAAASVLGLAACTGPIELSVFTREQTDADRLPDPDLFAESIHVESTRHLIDDDGWQYYAAMGENTGYCLIAINSVRVGEAFSSCSPTLPVGVGFGGVDGGLNIEMVPDGYSGHSRDGWDTLGPNLLIQTD